MKRRIIVAMAMAPLIAMAACQKPDSPDGSADAAARSRGTGRTSGDSIVIRTTDGTMSLGLVHDTVFMGLTDSVLTAARTDMARDTEETGNAFAGTIERFVKKSVSSALQSRIKYPLADLDSATYRDGTIKFAYRDRRRMAFEDVSQNGHKALQGFAPADAQQFVTTVNSAIHTVRGSF
jgi:hypothetical protein